MGLLIVILFVGILAGNIVGEIFRVFFHFLGLRDNVVEKALINPLVTYHFNPITLNLIILSITFGFTLDFSAISLLGMGMGWYYRSSDNYSEFTQPLA